MAVYLVTGGAGFIGSHIAEELLRRGEQVRVLDNFSTGKRSNLQFPTSNPKSLEIIEGDVCDRSAVQRAVSGADYVLHQAALISVQRSVDEPATTNEINVTGTLHVLQAAREANVKRIVVASSAAVYGNDPALPKHEAMPTQTLSPYAASKLAGEAYCRAFCDAYGLPAVALRYFNVFGPRQDPASHYSAAIPRFITAMLRGEAPTIYGDGLQTRDFIYVTNVVRANLLACEKHEAIGRVVNVAGGERYSIVDLHRDLAQMIGSSQPPIFAPPRAGEVKHSVAAIDLARQVLGYRVEVDWHAGLRRTVEWYARQ